MYIPKTIIAVAVLSASGLVIGAGTLFFGDADTTSIEKKDALELHKFSSSQLEAGALCYDHIRSTLPNIEPANVAETCKCMLTEVGKYGPSLQPALKELLLIGLEATAKTNGTTQRRSFVNEAISGNQSLGDLQPAQMPAIQNGIVHIMRSCKAST